MHDYLGNESDHFFDVPCLMLGLLTVLAVVAPVLVWQWRTHRGPAMVVAVSIGMVIAAAAASGVGALLVLLRYGALNVDTVPLLGSPSVAYVDRGAAGVLRTRAAADCGHAGVARGHRRPGVCGAARPAMLATTWAPCRWMASRIRW